MEIRSKEKVSLKRKFRFFKRTVNIKLEIIKERKLYIIP